MADEKKYTAREAAIAVLAKAQEILAKSSIIKKEEPEVLKKSAEYTSGFHTVEYFEPMNKAETGHERGINLQVKPKSGGGALSAKRGESPAGHTLRNHSDEVSKQAAQHYHKQKLGEMKGMPKPNLPKSEMLCSEHSLGKKEGFEIVKSEHCVKCMAKAEFAELYEDLAKMEKAEKRDENEIGTKFVKAENKDAPSNPMKPKIEEKPIERDNKNFEPQAQAASKPADHREAPLAAPAAGTAEKNGNPQAGSVPGKGVHKLSFFMGHRHNKRAGNKPPVG